MNAVGRRSGNCCAACETMGDGTEPIPRLDASTLKRYSAEVGQCATRRDLDNLTRRIWRSYDSPANQAALAQLRTRIEAQRDVLARNNPR